MNTAILSKAESLVTEAYAGPNAALPPSFGKILMDLLMNFLAGCIGGGGTPASALRLARSNKPQDKRAVELLAERSVRRDLRARFGIFGYARYDGDKIVASFVKLPTLKDDSDEYKVGEEDVADLAQLA